MPIKYQSRFTRQVIPKLRKGGLVIPSNATPLGSLPPKVARIAGTSPPTTPPTSFSFHYVDYPFIKDLFDDGKIINNGIYEFTVKDAVMGVYDLQAFENDEFCWSFATTDQTIILAALKIGETFDVKIKRPYKRILHISRYHFPPGVPDSGYGRFPIHITTDTPRNEWFRITTSYEPESQRTESRLPFFFGFRLFGFRRQDKRPMWRKFLSDAVIFAQNGDWGTGLMHVAFSLESFIDMLLIRAYKPSKFPDIYEDHLLRVGERREELHALWHYKLGKKEINKLYDVLNKNIFTPRNNIAHGRKNSEDINSNEYVQSIKTAIEFIWDLDRSSRKYLVPVMHLHDPSSLINQSLIKNCGSDAILTKRGVS
jgi:hypothetical protein